MIMHINEIVVCDTPTSPFVKEQLKKRNAVPLRGLVTPVYLYWYPVLSLRDRLIAACGQSLNSVFILVISGPSFALTFRVFLPLLLKGPSFHVLMSFRSQVRLSSRWWWISFITECCCCCCCCCTVSLLAFNTLTGTIGFP